MSHPVRGPAGFGVGRCSGSAGRRWRGAGRYHWRSPTAAVPGGWRRSRHWTRPTCPGAWPIPPPLSPAPWRWGWAGLRGPRGWPAPRPRGGGRAVTVGMPAPLPEGVRRLGQEEGLPPLPDFAISLLRGPGPPVAEALARHIEENFRLDVTLAASARA